jgi:hypothetical protein
MIIPLLITAGVLGGMYYFGQAPAAAAPAAPTPPTPMPPPTPAPPVPAGQIPTDLQRRMQTVLMGLPPELQNAIPPGSYGDPNAWAQIAQNLLMTYPPASPQATQQAPELLAIAAALQGLQGLQVPGGLPGGLQIPGQPPMGLPPIPPGPNPVTLSPQLEAELRSVLMSLPPQYANALPLPPPQPGVMANIDPSTIILLSTEVEQAGRALGMSYPQAAQLRSIAARAGGAPVAAGATARTSMNFVPGPVPGPATATASDVQQMLDFLARFNALPPVSGLPARIAGLPHVGYGLDQVGRVAARRYF